MRNSQSTYPLRLPNSIKAEVVRRAKADGSAPRQGRRHELKPVRGDRCRRKAGGHEHRDVLR
ncbi:MAG: hypothetical protein AW11_04048 [Candidatus Accumulibacter regalis]|uniref:Uncharacterized protein n=1 Tax=Accumulibacter regalis TaxID=522306 RepID=A0A011P8X4_ACCRE|nr:MAG: hypothetical protein AW11_04048 [Candidatus Accumulibacter regalis]